MKVKSISKPLRIVNLYQTKNFEIVSEHKNKDWIWTIESQLRLKLDRDKNIAPLLDIFKFDISFNSYEDSLTFFEKYLDDNFNLYVFE